MALAEGVALIVLSLMGQVAAQNGFPLAGIGLTALALRQILDK